MKEIIKKIFRLLNPPSVIRYSINMIEPKRVLEGRCALITGGTSGIGFSIAEYFIKSGASVVITGRDEIKLKRAVEKLNLHASDNIVSAYVLDNMKPELFDKSFEEILSGIRNNNIERLDILVNNAGVNASPMPNANIEDYNRVMNTNLRGVFFLSQLFGKYMVLNNIHGNILNIASASSLRPADSAYTLSKWGIRGLTLGLAKSLGNYGITVNGIAPGPTATPMMLKEGEANIALDRIQLGRYVVPEEIANMAVILVSDLGRSIMGDLIYMTGGAGLLTYDDIKYNF